MLCHKSGSFILQYNLIERLKLMKTSKCHVYTVYLYCGCMYVHVVYNMIVLINLTVVVRGNPFFLATALRCER